MSQLTTELKTHALTTIGGNVYFITENQRQTAINADMNTALILGDIMLLVHQIAEIIPINIYYENHPEKRAERSPAHEQDFTNSFLPKKLKKEERITVLRQTLKGYIDYWKGRDMPECAKLFGMRIKEKIQEAKGN